LHKNGEVLNYLAKNCRQSISDEELESLKDALAMIHDLPARDVADFIDLIADIPVLGTILNVYDFFQVLDYKGTLNDLEKAIENNKGIVIEKQISVNKNMAGNGSSYVPHKQYILQPKVSLWDGVYMDSDFLLYGTYTPNENWYYEKYVSGDNEFNGIKNSATVVKITSNACSLRDDPNWNGKPQGHPRPGREFEYVGTSVALDGKEWYAMRTSEGDIVYVSADYATLSK